MNETIPSLVNRGPGTMGSSRTECFKFVCQVARGSGSIVMGIKDVAVNGRDRARP